MTGASNTLDPIAAAEAGIAGSKNLMAAVADELSQQQRWLAHYQVAEKRHARRLKVQERSLSARSRPPRLDALLAAGRFAPLRLARAVALFVARTAVALFDSAEPCRHGLHAWLRPRAYALALLVERWLAASWAWTAATARALAVALARRSSAAWVWTRVHAAMSRAWRHQGRRDRLVMARRDIARARRRAGTWAGQDPETDQGAVSHSRAQCGSRGSHSLHLDRSEFAAARRVACAMALRQRGDGPARSHRAWALAGDAPAKDQSAIANYRAQRAARNAAIASTWTARPRRSSPSRCGNGPGQPGNGLAWRLGSSRAHRSRERGRHRSWTDANSRMTADALRRNASAGAAWSAANAKTAARASLAAASAGVPGARANVEEHLPPLKTAPSRRSTPTTKPWCSGAAPR